MSDIFEIKSRNQQLGDIPAEDEPSDSNVWSEVASYIWRKNETGLNRIVQGNGTGDDYLLIGMEAAVAGVAVIGTGALIGATAGAGAFAAAVANTGLAIEFAGAATATGGFFKKVIDQ